MPCARKIPQCMFLFFVCRRVHGEAEKRTYTIHHMPEKFSSVCFALLSKVLLICPPVSTFFLFLHPLHRYDFPTPFSLLACSPKKKKKKSTQNTAINLAVTCLLYFREIRKNSRRITWRPRFKPQLCH